MKDHWELFDISDDFKTIIAREKGYSLDSRCPVAPFKLYKSERDKWKQFGPRITDDLIQDDCDFGYAAKAKLTNDGKNFILHNFSPQPDSFPQTWGFAKIFEIKGN